MKSLKNILEASILDIEGTLATNDIAKICPPPTNKDWIKNAIGYTNINWQCKELLNPILQRNPEIVNSGIYRTNVDDITGIRASIDSDKFCELHLLKDNCTICRIEGFGGIEEYPPTLPKVKKIVLSVLTYLSKNPVALEKIISTAISKRNELHTRGSISCIPFEKILKF